MPNWCSNHLKVTGDEAALDAFLQATTDEEGNFQFCHLAPIDEAKTPSMFGPGHDTWGTKWDLESDVTFDRTDPTTAVAMFDTAWSPPIAWLETASTLHPTLTFALGYDESGVDFSGMTVMRGGEEDEDASFDGPSESFGSCPVPDCENYVEGRYPWEPKPEDLTPTYCEDHKLVEAVVRANNQAVTV